MNVDIKDFQYKILEIAFYFDEFCKKYDIEYYKTFFAKNQQISPRFRLCDKIFTLETVISFFPCPEDNPRRAEEVRFMPLPRSVPSIRRKALCPRAAPPLPPWCIRPSSRFRSSPSRRTYSRLWRGRIRRPPPSYIPYCP